jgi:large subunit ribosomal protein L9
MSSKYRSTFDKQNELYKIVQQLPIEQEFIPKILIQAQSGEISDIITKLAELLKKEEARLAVVKARAAKINGMSLAFTMRVSDEGKLFGSVGTAEIANAIKASGGDVHKSEVVLSEGALRQIGDYQVVISLEHGEVTAKVNVKITVEG